MILSSNHVIVNINNHWRLTWSLTSKPVEISRGMRKLVQTPQYKKKSYTLIYMIHR
jgi:hypothetical protein